MCFSEAVYINIVFSCVSISYCNIPPTPTQFYSERYSYTGLRTTLMEPKIFFQTTSLDRHRELPLHHLFGVLNSTHNIGRGQVILKCVCRPALSPPNLDP